MRLFFYLGVIKLRDGVQTEQLKQRDLYQLAVVAVDDGACCKDQTGVRHTSTATVRIGKNFLFLN